MLWLRLILRGRLLHRHMRSILAGGCLGRLEWNLQPNYRATRDKREHKEGDHFWRLEYLNYCSHV